MIDNSSARKTYGFHHGDDHDWTADEYSLIEWDKNQNDYINRRNMRYIKIWGKVCNRVEEWFLFDNKWILYLHNTLFEQYHKENNEHEIDDWEQFVTFCKINPMIEINNKEYRTICFGTIGIVLPQTMKPHAITLILHDMKWNDVTEQPKGHIW